MSASATRLGVIVVTGSAGFLGAATVRALRARGHRVVATDRLALDGTIAVDVRDSAALTRALEGADVVVHGAAVVGVHDVRTHLIAATTVNVVGTVAVLSAAAAAGVTRFVDLSSEEVYGAAAGPLVEDSPTVPTSAYGVHKVAGELLAREFPEIGYVAARLSWVYGPRFPRNRPPQLWLDDAAAGRISPPSPGADHVADLVHVDDAVRAVVALAEADQLAHRAYNVASGAGATLREVAAVIRGLRPAWDVKLAAGMLPGVSQRAPLHVARIREELGWVPNVSLEEGLRRTLDGP